jgi:hypothetical protein
MSTTATASDQARAVARRFIDAFNARDVRALGDLVTEDVELRPLRGDPLRGQDGLRALLAAAEEHQIRMVPLKGDEVEEHEGRRRVCVPIRELVGPDDIERLAEFEIRDGRVAAFSVRPAVT